VKSGAPLTSRMICSKKNTNMRCHGQEVVGVLPGVRLAGVPDLGGELALRRDGGAEDAVISSALVVAPLTKCVYHCHSQLSRIGFGRSEHRAHGVGVGRHHVRALRRGDVVTHERRGLREGLRDSHSAAAWRPCLAGSAAGKRTTWGFSANASSKARNSRGIRSIAMSEDRGVRSFATVNRREIRRDDR
jgi:hypothetical protein